MNTVPRYAGKILRRLKMACFCVTETWDSSSRTQMPIFDVGNTIVSFGKNMF